MITKEEIITQAEGEPIWFKDMRLGAFSIYETTSQLDETQKLVKGSLSITAPEGVNVLKLSEALEQEPHLVKNHYMTCIRPENKETALHFAAVSDAVFIVIPKETELHHPIEIDTTHNSISHIVIIAQAHSKATIIEKNSSQEGSYSSTMVEVIVNEEANLTYSAVQNIAETIENITVRRAHVHKGASIAWIGVNIGSKKTVEQVRSELLEEGSHSTSNAIFFGHNKQVFDFDMTSKHHASHTTSNMTTHGAAKDSAKIRQLGSVDTAQKVVDATGKQDIKGILLTQGAEIKAIPELLINSEDVKCMHGASIGQLDKEKIFYAMSRGISQKEATALLVEGFLDPVVEKIDNEELQGEIREKIVARI